jgi:hypothetical protein
VGRHIPYCHRYELPAMAPCNDGCQLVGCGGRCVVMAALGGLLCCCCNSTGNMAPLSCSSGAITGDAAPTCVVTTPLEVHCRWMPLCCVKPSRERHTSVADSSTTVADSSCSVSVSLSAIRDSRCAGFSCLSYLSFSLSVTQGNYITGSFVLGVGSGSMPTVSISSGALDITVANAIMVLCPSCSVRSRFAWLTG